MDYCFLLKSRSINLLLWHSFSPSLHRPLAFTAVMRMDAPWCWSTQWSSLRLKVKDDPDVIATSEFTHTFPPPLSHDFFFIEVHYTFVVKSFNFIMKFNEVKRFPTGSRTTVNYKYMKYNYKYTKNSTNWWIRSYLTFRTAFRFHLTAV